MKNTLTKAGLSILTLSLVACGGSDGTTEPAVPNMNVAPPPALFGGTYVYDKNGQHKPGSPYIHNNAKDDGNPIYDLHAVYFDGLRIPLPVKGANHISDKAPYYIADGKAYKVFIANNSKDMAYSRYAYLVNANNDQSIYSYSGAFTRDMPKTGIANYQGTAVHSFEKRNGRRYITHANASAQIDFSKPHDDSAMLTVKVSPKYNDFKPFEFGARVQDHAFNGKDNIGTYSADKANPNPRLPKDRVIVQSQGQFNGPNAAELVGHYQIGRNSEYPYGAEGVFGLKKED